LDSGIARYLYIKAAIATIITYLITYLFTYLLNYLLHGAESFLRS